MPHQAWVIRESAMRSLSFFSFPNFVWERTSAKLCFAFAFETEFR